MISVIIPAFNAEKFILGTLESVKNQTYKNFEIIVIDDGSVDKTKAVVDQFLKKNSLKGQCFRQENKKIAAARNKGISLAKGLFIALLDADDLWYPEKLTKIIQKFEEFPNIDMICSRENVVRNQRLIFSTPVYSNKNDDLHFDLLIKKNRLSPSATVFKKALGDKIGNFRENLEFNTVEDYDFWIRFSKIGKVYFLPEILGEYILRDSSASSNLENHFNNLINVLNDHLIENSNNAYLTFKLKIRISEIYGRLFFKLIRAKSNSIQLKNYLAKMFCFPFSIKNILFFTIGVSIFLMRRVYNK